MLGREIPVLRTNVLELPCRRVDYLHVAGKVPLPVDFAELAERLVRDVCDIKLMVTCERPPVNTCRLTEQRR